jgi:hypothetical protein
MGLLTPDRTTSTSPRCDRLIPGNGLMSYHCSLPQGHEEQTKDPADPQPCYAVESTRSTTQWDQWARREADRESAGGKRFVIGCPACGENTLAVDMQARLAKCSNCGEEAEIPTVSLPDASVAHTLDMVPNFVDPEQGVAPLAEQPEEDPEEIVAEAEMAPGWRVLDESRPEVVAMKDELVRSGLLPGESDEEWRLRVGLTSTASTPDPEIQAAAQRALDNPTEDNETPFGVVQTEGEDTGSSSLTAAREAARVAPTVVSRRQTCGAWKPGFVQDDCIRESDHPGWHEGGSGERWEPSGDYIAEFIPGEPYGDTAEPTKQRDGDQVLPAGGDRAVQVEVLRRVGEWVEAGKITAAEGEMLRGVYAESIRVGVERYGQPLRTFDGRLNIRDLADELRDGLAYVTKMQMIAEADKPTLVRMVAEAIHKEFISGGESDTRAFYAEAIAGVAVDRILDWVLLQRMGPMT